MVWGGVSFRHCTPLIVIDGTYISEVLRPAVVPFFTADSDVSHFQQDSSRPHSACVTTAFLFQKASTCFHVRRFQGSDSIWTFLKLFRKNGKTVSSAVTDTSATGSSIPGRLEEHTASSFYAEKMPCMSCSKRRTLGTDLRIFISIIIGLLLVVLRCTIKFSISNT